MEQMRKAEAGRLEGLVEAMAFWPTAWRLAVSVGEPRAFLSPPLPDGSRTLHLGLMVGWEREVLGNNLGVLRGVGPLSCFEPAFTLAAWTPPAPPEGADGCWWVQYCWWTTTVHQGYTWLVRYAGRDYFSPASAELAMARAAADLEAGLDPKP